MHKAFSVLLKLSFFTLSWFSVSPSIAQVTTDGTVNTQVNQNGNAAEITGGETRGSNLFHSFQDFSVNTGNEAVFNNADSISNIFSRVTGGNTSNIDGAIRANGSASLFLINPAGIIFGENASLDIGGSFYGSSASSILFENGEFSAADLENPPLLTVNAPIGLGFRDNPGDISSNQSSLQVNNGQNLFLLGGNLNFDGATISASGGRIELGGLTEPGIVNINDDGSLSFPEAVARGDVSLANSAQIFVAGEEGGSIGINAQNLSIASGSILFAGINVDSGFPDAQAGDIVIDLTEDLVIDGLGSENVTNIANANFGTGNAGNIEVAARNVRFNNGGNITLANTGAGNIGDVTITATEDISFDGISDLSISGVFSFVDEQATGSTGEINLTAQNLNLTNGGSISSGVSGSGDGGNINLNIADTIRVDGFGLLVEADGTQTEIPSEIVSSVSGSGDSGNINIETQNLSLSREGFISVSNTGQGNAGNININVDSLSITGRGINGNINGTGNGGNITIDARENISIDGSNSDRSFTGILADINSDGVGEAGNIEINTARLSVNDAFISADVLGSGNGGSIAISATDSLELSNTGLIQADIFEGATGNGGNLNIETRQLTLNSGSDISADILEGATGNGGEIIISTTNSLELSDSSFISADVTSGTGNGGNINIETGQLTLNSASRISATTFSDGIAGTVTIRANESINLSGTSESFRGGILANALEGSGNGGNVDLVTGELTISDEAIITASNFSSRGVASGGAAPGTGEPGNINIIADSLSLASAGRIEARTQAETGEGANINLEIADSIFLRGNSFISAEALNNANGGNLNIDTNFIVAFPNGNNDIIASAEQGNGGNININAESLFGIGEGNQRDSRNDIDASSEFNLNGNVTIDTLDIDPIQGATELPSNVIVPEQTVAQACTANNGTTAMSSLTINGKGGIPAAPDLPLNSQNIAIESSSSNSNVSASPQPITTSQGKIQPARGIKVTESGEVVLTAYRTDNWGERVPQGARNCG